MNIFKKVRTIFILFSFLFFFSVTAQSTVTEDVAYFSSLTSRVPGYPGNKAAADYISARFRSLGLQEIKREAYSVTVPVEEFSTLEYQGRKIKISALWPNHVRTSTLPPDGITGNLVYGGDGSLVNYSGNDLKGAVVLLDFNCGFRWMDAGLLGAQAVIFIAPEDTTFFEARRKFLSIPLDLPRFYVTREDADFLLSKLRRAQNTKAVNSVPVKLSCRQSWQKAPTENILGYITGTDPKLRNDIICLSAYYDSNSVVPSLAPGADQASSIAGLLDLAAYFSQNPPRRTILFLANGSHFQTLRGMGDFVKRHYRKEKTFLTKEMEPINLKLLIGLELSSHSDLLATYHNSSELYAQRYFAPFAKKFLEYVPAAFSGKLLNGVSPERGVAFSAFLPEGISTDGSLSIRFGLPSLSFVTVYDNRRYFDTPVDIAARVDIGKLTTQVELLRQMLYRAFNDSEFFPEAELAFNDSVRTLRGRIVSFDPKTSFVPNQPVANAIVCPRYLYVSYQNRKSAYGVRGEYLELTDAKGRFTINQIFANWGILEAFYLDPENGRITMAPDRGVNGAENYPMNFTFDAPVKDWSIVLFNCVSTNLYDFIDPRYLIGLDKMDVFNSANSIPSAYGFSYLELRSWEWSSEVEPAAVIYSEPGMEIKVAGETGPLGKRILLLNSPDSKTKADSEGLGYPLTDDSSLLTLTPYRACRDMINLNDYRINNFKQFGISNERLLTLHEEAKKWFSVASENLAQFNWYSFLTNSRRAVGLESRAYPDVQATTNDVIKGLIFYFIILLPFAFFSERLFFGFTDIRKQIAGIFTIFLAVYLALRFVHPGFRLSNSPEVILLAFIILVLSVLVIFLIAGKFEEQMQRLKRERAKVYETDVGRIAATGVAFNLGIANMKRRKLRTTLTAITLILLTFTVISFTSIKSYLSFNQVARGYSPAYEGLMIRDRAWSPLEELGYEYVKNEFSEKAVVASRSWLLNPTIEDKTFTRVAYGKQETFVSGLLGLTVQEPLVTGFDRLLVAGKWFGTDTEKSVIISENMAKNLNFPVSELGQGQVNIFGEDLKVVGIVSDAKLNDYSDLDGERLTPVDFAMMPSQEMSKFKMEHAANVMSGGGNTKTFTHQEAANVVIVPFQFLRQRGGTVQSMAVKFNPGYETRKEIEDFVSRLAVTIFAGINGKTSVYSSLGLTSFSGIGNLFIPILIASLIVLNTMMGAVYERIREIGIYSSVGLAPSHIAALFFAEACVYSVLGAVAGYLLGQVVSKALLTAGLLKGLTLNYSSLSAVSSTIIVMAVVFISTIFPARKASQMSVPDVTRRWVLPKPDGDAWVFGFPFTVGEGEVLGLMTFLRDYFSSYSIEAVGYFYTADNKLFEETGPKGKSYVTSCRVYLAPFDLGVSQQFKLSAFPAGEFGFYGIEVRMERESGEGSDWQRLNRRFLDSIRKQFLVWRTISKEIKEDYRQEGEKELKNG
ncbi:MAG: FtsX-like permease family protein [Candidatus Ratteibacteria bacterium]|jgi:ABC-type antimicrobial peptide transport system permease subunit